VMALVSSLPSSSRWRVMSPMVATLCLCCVDP
jgi:hypothetical protein